MLFDRMYKDLFFIQFFTLKQARQSLFDHLARLGVGLDLMVMTV